MGLGLAEFSTAGTVESTRRLTKYVTESSFNVSGCGPNEGSLGRHLAEKAFSSLHQ